MPENADVVAKAKEILAKGDAFIIADLEPKDLLAVADLPEAKNSIIMNIRSSADSLRQEDCRSNVFHVIPSYAMRADALGQYFDLEEMAALVRDAGQHAGRSGLCRNDQARGRALRRPGRRRQGL